jgi:hypothetical protein
MKKYSALSKAIVNKTVLLFAVGALSSTAGATQLDVTNEAEKTAEELAEIEEITDRRHPEFVRCRTESIIGKLASKRKVCMTNEQWAEARKSGNRLANDMISSIQTMSGGGSFTDGK